VVKVPPSLTSRERSGRPRLDKTDPFDAVAIARITAREPNLPPVRLAVGQAAGLWALADYRAKLVAERTAVANRTHTEPHGLLPRYQAEIPRLTAPTFITAAQDLLAGETGVRVQPTRRRLTRLAELTAEMQEVAAYRNRLWWPRVSGGRRRSPRRRPRGSTAGCRPLADGSRRCASLPGGGEACGVKKRASWRWWAGRA
jgi:hypothetical protein